MALDAAPASLPRARARGGPVLALEGVAKSFPGVRALQGVSFDVAPGEVHALLGENGAGKSTLIKIISGVYQPDAGEIRLDGAPVRFLGPHEARRAGIATIYQELLLFPELTTFTISIRRRSWARSRSATGSGWRFCVRFRRMRAS
jgi:ABC-type sugar transport system ATPase subunit